MPGEGELDGREINADDPQPVTGQCAGRRQAVPPAQIGDRGAVGQQAGQLGGPAGVAADVLRGRSGCVTVITAVGNRNGVVAAADKIALGSKCCRIVGLHTYHLPAGWLRPRLLPATEK